MAYVVKAAQERPALDGQWDSDAWQHANVLTLGHFRPESSDHRPRTQAKLLHTNDGIHGIFRVDDQYVRCVNTEFQSSVCADSCVEFFVKPDVAEGYFNFEFNCGGTLHSSYLRDCTRVATGFKDCVMLTPELGSQVQIYHSLPKQVDPEITTPQQWCLQFFIPFEILCPFVPSLNGVVGRTWRANFYKCADQTSHPHWASWAPVTEMNFHLPDCFAPIHFEDASQHGTGPGSNATAH